MLISVKAWKTGFVDIYGVRGVFVRILSLFTQRSPWLAGLACWLAGWLAGLGWLGPPTASAPKSPKYKEKVVLIPDNEPRNKQVCKQIEQCIKDGYSVVLWPHSVKEKDINDMILSGYTSAEIQELIHNNTHKDLQAQTVFSSWKRI